MSTKRTANKREPVGKNRASAGQARGYVGEYIRGLSGWQKQVVSELRSLVLAAAPEAKETMKWGQPVYDVNGPCCYISAHASAVNLGFWRGKELMREYPELESGGGKNMRHIKIRDPKALRKPQLSAVVRRAVELNKEKVTSGRTSA